MGEREAPLDSGKLPGVSMISSWVGVPAASSLTGVPSTPSGLSSPRARPKLGLPCKKLLIFDSRLGGETEGAEELDGGAEGGGGGGGGGESCLSSSLSLEPLLKLLTKVGLAFELVGLRRTLTPADSGEFRVGGADVFVTFCKREDKPEARRKSYSFLW